MSQFCTKGEAEHLLVPEHVTHFLVAHLRQRRVHHHDEADGDGDGRGANGQAGDGMSQTRREVADGDPGEHRQENPERQVAVKEGEPAFCRMVARGSIRIGRSQMTDSEGRAYRRSRSQD